MFARLCLIFHLINIVDARQMGATPPVLDVVSEAVARQVAHFMHDILA